MKIIIIMPIIKSVILKYLDSVVVLLLEDFILLLPYISHLLKFQQFVN